MHCKGQLTELHSVNRRAGLPMCCGLQRVHDSGDRRAEPKTRHAALLDYGGSSRAVPGRDPMPELADSPHADNIVRWLSVTRERLQRLALDRLQQVHVRHECGPRAPRSSTPWGHSRERAVVGTRSWISRAQQFDAQQRVGVHTFALSRAASEVWPASTREVARLAWPKETTAERTVSRCCGRSRRRVATRTAATISSRADHL